MTEKSAKEIETQIAKVNSATQAVKDQALAAVAAAEKTNADTQKLLDYRTNLLNELRTKYGVEQATANKMQTVVQTGDLQIVNSQSAKSNMAYQQTKSEVMDMQTVTPVPGVPAFVEGVTNLRDQIITVMDLRKRLGLPDKSIANEKIIIIDLGTSTLDESILGVGKQGNHLTIILDIAKTISRVQNTA